MTAHFREVDALEMLTGLKAYPGKACDGCTKCCEILPVREIGLGAFTRCPKLTGPPAVELGCSIYSSRPGSCRRWSCVWLTSDLPEKFKPSRCGVVVDPLPDTVLINGKPQPCAQIWVSRSHEADFETPDIRELLGGTLGTGLYVLWMMAPKPDGRRFARVFALDRAGNIEVSPEFPQSLDGLPGSLKTEHSRLQKAQALLRARAE